MTKILLIGSTELFFQNKVIKQAKTKIMASLEKIGNNLSI